MTANLPRWVIRNGERILQSAHLNYSDGTTAYWVDVPVETEGKNDENPKD